MAPPPAKRQKRLTLSSDDEDEDEGARVIADASFEDEDKNVRRSGRSAPKKSTAPVQTLHASTSTKSNTRSNTKSNGKSSSRSTPTSSPDKKKSRAVVTDTVKSKSLHLFFGKASDEQRWPKKENRGDKPLLEEEIEDIDDDSEDEKSDIKKEPGLNSLPFDGQRSVHQDSGAANQSNGALLEVFPKQGLPVLSSQRFAKPSLNRNSPRLANLDQRPWADKYAPMNLEELAIHKKKALDVRSWLHEASQHPARHRLLILKGPAGSGKSTTMSLIAKAMNINPVEWKNSTTADGLQSTSFVAHFDDFLGRGGRFGSLSLMQPTENEALSKANVGERESVRRILVMDDYPTTFTRSATALYGFRSAVLAYLAKGAGSDNPLFSSSKTQEESGPPLIMIISETLLSSATASTDSFTAHRLLGPEISNHPSTHTIEFNPVAPTFVAKALDEVIKKEARTSKRRRIPGPVILKRLSEMGDLRSAVNSLEFLCLRGDETGDWGGRIASQLKKGRHENVAMSATEQESLEMITQRESTLGMFHAVGKVVYNKRDEPNTSLSTVISPPSHLSRYERPRTSQVSVDSLMDETGTDVSTFVSSLHENYVLSCNGASFIDHLNDCIAYLSDCDLLDTDSRRSTILNRSGVGTARPNIQTGSTDLVRQNEITFDVAVRGLLFALPSPVSRATHPSGRRGDSHKMFFPAALRLWKKTEEIEDVISLWRSQLDHTSNPAAWAKTNRVIDGGVASWRREIIFSDDSRASEDVVDSPRLVSSRADLLLDLLPFTSKIQRAKNIDLPGLKLVTQFEGIGPPVDEDEALMVEDEADIPFNGKRNDPSIPPNKATRPVVIAKPGAISNALNQKIEAEALVEKLYISDDDIEDD